MADIQNTTSDALFKYVRVLDGFMGSTNQTLNNIQKLTDDVSSNWKGPQQQQFAQYVEEFGRELSKQMAKLKELQAGIFNKAQILKELESRKFKG